MKLRYLEKADVKLSDDSVVWYTVVIYESLRLVRETLLRFECTSGLCSARHKMFLIVITDSGYACISCLLYNDNPWSLMMLSISFETVGRHRSAAKIYQIMIVSAVFLLLSSLCLSEDTCINIDANNEPYQEWGPIPSASRVDNDTVSLVNPNATVIVASPQHMTCNGTETLGKRAYELAPGLPRDLNGRPNFYDCRVDQYLRMPGGCLSKHSSTSLWN